MTSLTPSAKIWRLIFALCLLLPCVSRCEILLRTAANQSVEASFISGKSYADPFNEIDLDVIISTPQGETQTVPAFWDGGETWKFRYAAPHPGVYHFRTRCSDPANATLHNISGTIEITPYRGDNAFFKHGPMRVAADKIHFEHLDGTPFLWLADTWWMGLCRRLHWPDDFKALTADRVEKGFNVVQIVAGLYPDMPAFDPRGANEAGFPWTRDYARINPEYLDAADRRIEWLVGSGISPCIVGAWGYHIPWLGLERMKKHWRYLVARYGSQPVFWCLAGEGVMPFYLSKDRDAESKFQKQSLTALAAYMRQIDPYHHPVSIHPSDLARNQLDDASLIDFDMLQTGHSDRASIAETIRRVGISRAAKPAMPTINAEVCYEGIMGTCAADIERFMVWTCLLSGAAGHTYGANGIWQVNEPDQPYGNSPGGNNWGTTPWPDAAQLPGSRQTGLAAKCLAGFPWWQFTPHPEWAAFDATNAPPRLGSWIWFPEGNPAQAAPVAKRYFRRSFELPDATAQKAVLTVAVDDRFEIFLNGKPVASRLGWKPYQQFDVKELLLPGRNTLAIIGENVAAAVTENPAGLVCGLEITLPDGRRMEVASDAQWRVAKIQEPRWTAINFDDHAWTNALVVAKYGEGPWGDLASDETAVAPSAAGIPGKIRVIYIPKTEPLRVRHLEVGRIYRARFFNPQNGKWIEAGMIPGEKDSWLAPESPAGSPDWVLVLESRN